MVHDLAWRRFPDAFPARGRRWHEAALARALQRGDLFMVPSAPTADDLVAAGAPAGRVEVVEEGCDHLDPPDIPGAAALLERIGVKGAFVLSVSTIEPRKNLTRLAAAFTLAAPRLTDPRTALVVVGPTGWDSGSRNSGASAPDWRSGPSSGEGGLSAGDRGGPVVLTTGTVSGGVLTALYQRALAFVYVPLFEGFGLPPLEAMMLGTPVVASPIPSTGSAAWEVDPTDVDAIAEGLVRVCTDRAQRESLSELGRDRAAGLTWRTAANRHCELWQSLL